MRLTARYSMVYIAKEAWPEKKDFLKENINNRCRVLPMNCMSQAIVYPTFSKVQGKSLLSKNNLCAHTTHLASSTIF